MAVNQLFRRCQNQFAGYIDDLSDLSDLRSTTEIRTPALVELVKADERSCAVASTPEYLEYVLDLLRGVPEVTTRKMMGEYLLYASGKLFGGVYDDRLLVKDTEASRAALATLEIPYEGASPMRLVDIEDADAMAAIVAAMLGELPEPKRRRR